MTLAFHTLGCKANQFDTQAMIQIAENRGHTVVGFSGLADVYVINTCTVTAESDRKSRQIIRSARARSPDAVVAACGCYSQVSPDRVRELGVDIVAGSADRAGFIAKIEVFCASRMATVDVPAHIPGETFEILPAGGYDGRTRALLKIQDGCDNYCAYCIIPYSRGHVRSLPVADAVEAIKSLKNSGCREVVLTGIEISSYGRDLPDSPALIDLLEALSPGAPDMRIHLGSLEPRTVTREFCQRLAALPNILRHFHLSLQSGCDEVLRAMGRRYDTTRFCESVTLLREFYPNCGITADLIAGFPGETGENFRETLAFIQRCKFSAMHVFPYSRRPGTAASGIPDLPKSIRAERARAATEVADRMRRDFLRAQLGKTLSVLFEAPDGDTQLGHSENYLPVRCASHVSLAGAVREVLITRADEECIYGEITDP